MGRIPALTIEVGNVESVDLTGYFSDPDSDVLKYTAVSSSSVATSAVSGATVRVTAVAAGNATVTVTASDPDGLSADQTFTVTVPNRAPEAVGQIDDAETFVGESIEIDLAAYFSDPDGDILSYAAASSSPGVATAAVSGATLRVAGENQGSATVTVTASDPGGLSATQTFKVTVPNRAPEVVRTIADAETLRGAAFEIALGGALRRSGRRHARLRGHLVERGRGDRRRRGRHSTGDGGDPGSRDRNRDGVGPGRALGKPRPSR